MSEDYHYNSPPQKPDPGEAYYLLWHRLRRIQYQIHEAMCVMIHENDTSLEIEKQIKALLIEPSDDLLEIIEELPLQQ